MRFSILIILAVLFCNLTSLEAQSCCSGGVPLSSQLGLPASEAGVLQINLSYDLNVLNTLKVGTTKLEDDSRNRKTHSGLLQLAYSWTNRFAVEGFFSFLSQKRSIIRSNTGTNTESTQGIGDAVLLFKYQLFSAAQSSTIAQIALGTKVPIGSYDQLSSDGLVLNAELQPGSGAWDGIAWGQLVHSLNWRPSMSWSTTFTFSRKGVNKNYFGGNQEYKFGNEWQIIAGLSDRLTWGGQLLAPSLSLRYRDAQPDRIDGFDLPSTGGQWLFLRPALSYWWSPDLSTNLSFELPLYGKVIGTQFSPTYRLNIGFFYKMRIKKDTATTHSFDP